MVKSFHQFVFENYEIAEDFIKDLTIKLISKIKGFSSDQLEKYSSFSGMNFDAPFSFDLILNIRKNSSPEIDQDERFNQLPWESINFKEKGYAIDAVTKIDRNKIKPEIIIYLLIDPDKEPHLYSKLYYRLIDILTHETNHLDQASKNRVPFNANPSDMDSRKKAQKNYRYFLLPDEIESMVEGIWARAKQQDLELDVAIHDYLRPLLISGYITKKQYSEVMETWVKYALQHYPGAKFSLKVKKIVDSI